MFVPKDFTPPELKTDRYIARKLEIRDVYLDYIAVMDSIDIIHKTRGLNSWPTPKLTIEDDMIDLGWHQREFEFKNSFAFTIMNPDETECLGCMYFYQAKEPEYEAEVSWWVTTKAYEEGLYDVISRDIKSWVKNEWPMKSVKYTNKLLPEGFGDW